MSKLRWARLGCRRLGPVGILAKLTNGSFKLIHCPGARIVGLRLTHLSEQFLDGRRGLVVFRLGAIGAVIIGLDEAITRFETWAQVNGIWTRPTSLDRLELGGLGADLFQHDF